MKIAVTGAGGFLGRHVLKALLPREVEVIALTRDAARLRWASASVQVVQMDISQPAPNCFVLAGCPDILIHLAWDGLPNYESLDHFEKELPAQYHFLKTMIKGGLPTLLATGSCFEYGMQTGPLSEEMPTKPNNPYGYAKDALRRQLEFLKSVKPFNLTWARLFYLYGEGQRGASLYSGLRDAVMRGDKAFNMTGGEQLRDYMAVEETANLIVELALRPGDHGIINVCSGQPVSVRRLVEEWLHVKHWRIELKLGHYPYPDYEPMAFWGDRRRLDRVLRHCNE